MSPMWAPLRGTLKASEIPDGPHRTDGTHQIETPGPGRLAEQLRPGLGSRRGRLSPLVRGEART